MTSPIVPAILLLASLLPLGQVQAQTFDTAAAAAYSEKQNGHALLIYKDGKLFYEKYGNGWSKTKAHRLASGTKSFTAVMLMAAAEDGLLKLDDKVALTLTEWKSDKRKSQITWRQLLGLVSGLYGGKTGSITSYALAPASKTIANPGKAFSYGPNPFQCFGEALKRILAKQTKKETVDQYLNRRLLKPMGIQVGYWRKASTGEPNLPSGAYLTAREWIKFGEMIRLGGLVGSKRILKASSLAPCFLSTPVRKNYGVGWWLLGQSPRLPDDFHAAMGAGKQRLFVLPSLGMTIVRFGESKGYAWDDTRFFEILIPARHKSFGTGCTGSKGTPLLAGQGQRPPVYGQLLGLDISSLPDKALGVLWLGLSNKHAGSLTLPLDLSPLGMKSCLLLASPDIPFPFFAPSTTASVLIPLPKDASLLGQSLYFQALIADTKANALGLTVSNGIDSHIGLK